MSEKCLACNGLGWIILRAKDNDGQRVDVDEDCLECNGTGVES